MAENRAWRKIAEEAATEPDSDRVADLTKELINALDEEATRPNTKPVVQRDEKKACRKAA